MTGQARDRWRMRPLVFVGYVTLFLLVFGIGAWGGGEPHLGCGRRRRAHWRCRATGRWCSTPRGA